MHYESNSDYQKYRGKCKEMSESLVSKNPELRLVRGFYICPVWGEEQHWWTEKPDGTIVDPTCKQFPSKGNGEYVEFDGICNCEICGKEVKENEAIIMGSYPCCSSNCARMLVGV